MYYYERAHIKDSAVKVTSATKQETRARILEAAAELFRKEGYDAATTRDIARASEIATGTLFNYFPTKEVLAMNIIQRALSEATAAFVRRGRKGATLEEDLFEHILCGLRALGPHRSFVGPVLETVLSPFARVTTQVHGDVMRVEHMATVSDILTDHGFTREPPFILMQLYWTLYLGVMAYWSTDDSPKQEDTLVLLDQSLKMFVSSLSRPESAVTSADEEPRSDAGDEP